MAQKRSSVKHIRKVIKKLEAAIAAATDVAVTIHTFTDPGTTKRIILDGSIAPDAFVNDHLIESGLCITSPGETLPALADVEAEENRWLLLKGGLTTSQTVGAFSLAVDSKIQRKVKDGDILSLVSRSTGAGHQAGFATVFVDET